MSEPFAPVGAPHPGLTGLSRLRSLIGRAECPPRPADELLSDWYEASGTALPFEEWCDPSARDLAAALHATRHPREIDGAVVRFAQARAGAEHTAEALAADLVALVRVVATHPAGPVWSAPVLQPDREGRRHDAINLVARALTAWAAEQVEAVSASGCTDPVTGLVTGGFLRARVRELHAQCDALAISPPVTFGALVVQLDLLNSPVPERMGARVAVARILVGVFNAGETVAALGSSRFVTVLPAAAVGRAEEDLRRHLTTHAEPGVRVQIHRRGFERHPEATWRSLAGVGLGA